MTCGICLNVLTQKNNICKHVAKVSGKRVCAVCLIFRKKPIGI